ncbi:MAG: hypothetical protein KA712_00620 [Myxococcales bacterium]|nr:hypothetical protein [Myxococcales bacterium]
MNLRAWLLAFLITQTIEVPIYTIGLRRKGLSTASLLGAGASAFTHPLVWFVIQPVMLPRVHYMAFVITAELFAWVTEALYLRMASVPWRRSLGLSLVANCISVTLGMVLMP